MDETKIKSLKEELIILKKYQKIKDEITKTEKEMEIIVSPYYNKVHELRLKLQNICPHNNVHVSGGYCLTSYPDYPRYDHTYYTCQDCGFSIDIDESKARYGDEYKQYMKLYNGKITKDTSYKG